MIPAMQTDIDGMLLMQDRDRGRLICLGQHARPAPSTMRERGERCAKPRLSNDPARISGYERTWFACALGCFAFAATAPSGAASVRPSPVRTGATHPGPAVFVAPVTSAVRAHQFRPSARAPELPAAGLEAPRDRQRKPSRMRASSSSIQERIQAGIIRDRVVKLLTPA